MNSIWLKIAGVAVVAVLVIVMLGRFGGGDKSASEAQSQSAEADKPKTVYDSFDRDAKEFRVQPQQEQTEVTAAQPSEPAAAGQEATGEVAPEPPQPKFEKLTLEQEVEAQKFLEMALAERKRSRLPMMTPKLMVDYCREIIRRWPRSEYAFQARRMLADIPERYQEMYKITDQEKDLSSFYQ